MLSPMPLVDSALDFDFKYHYDQPEMLREAGPFMVYVYAYVFVSVRAYACFCT